MCDGNHRRRCHANQLTLGVLLAALCGSVAQGCDSTEPEPAMPGLTELEAPTEAAPVVTVMTEPDGPFARPTLPDDLSELGDHPELSLAGRTISQPEPRHASQHPETQRGYLEAAAEGLFSEVTLEEIDCREYPCLIYARLTGEAVEDESRTLTSRYHRSCTKCDSETHVNFDDDGADVILSVYPRSNDSWLRLWIKSRNANRIELRSDAR